jgi:16S rRNA (cytosine967-C5)-methyltransferase
LIYSVCSLEPQEGEAIVTAFLAAHPDFRFDQPTDLPDFVTPDPTGRVRILPGLLEQQGGLDGFFMARLVRSGD